MTTIKPEYLNKTVKVYDRILGTRTIVVAKIDMNKIPYYKSIGLGHIFNEDNATTTVEDIKVVKYEAVEGPIPDSTPKPKKKRKKKDANS